MLDHEGLMLGQDDYEGSIFRGSKFPVYLSTSPIRFSVNEMLSQCQC